MTYITSSASSGSTLPDLSTFTPNIYLSSDSPLPYVPSVYISPIKPIVPVVTQPVMFPLHPSLDLNRDPKLHKMMTDYFYYKTLDKWLRREKDMLDLLNYLYATDSKVDVLNSMNDYKESNIDKDTQATVDKKIEFIEKHILSKDGIYNILKNYVKETSTSWYDLEKNTYFIKELIRKYLKKKLIHLIEGKLGRK